MSSSEDEDSRPAKTFDYPIFIYIALTQSGVGQTGVDVFSSLTSSLEDHVGVQKFGKRVKGIGVDIPDDVQNAAEKHDMAISCYRRPRWNDARLKPLGYHLTVGPRVEKGLAAVKFAFIPSVLKAIITSVSDWHVKHQSKQGMTVTLEVQDRQILHSDSGLHLACRTDSRTQTYLEDLHRRLSESVQPYLSIIPAPSVQPNLHSEIPSSNDLVTHSVTHGGTCAIAAKESCSVNVVDPRVEPQIKRRRINSGSLPYLAHVSYAKFPLASCYRIPGVAQELPDHVSFHVTSLQIMFGEWVYTLNICPNDTSLSSSHEETSTSED